jgi:hypothetical protein
MPKRFRDRATVRFPPGMLTRFDAVLKPGADRVAFILAATAAALRRAEQKVGRNPGIDCAAVSEAMIQR